VGPGVYSRFACPTPAHEELLTDPSGGSPVLADPSGGSHSGVVTAPGRCNPARFSQHPWGTLNPQPSTPNPKPQIPKTQIPNPKPQTPNTKHQTPHPKPQAPNLNPQTPNTTSQTPMFNPSTMNPKPQTIISKPKPLNPEPAGTEEACSIEGLDFSAPSGVHVVGSFLLRALARPALSVDLAGPCIPIQSQVLATHREPSALYCWILEILYCTPKKRRALLRIPTTGRAKCLPMLGSLKT
jgi:hypothetical protein